MGTDNTLLLLLALTAFQQPGTGLPGAPGTPIDNNLFSNPFLLFALLGNDGNSNNNDLLLYLLLTSQNGGVGGGGLDPTTNFANPLILLTLLDDSAGSNNNLLLLSLLSGGLGFPVFPTEIPRFVPPVLRGQCNFGFILPLLLLAGNNNSFGIELSQDVYFVLLSTFCGFFVDPVNGGGIGDLLPFLLLSGSGSDNLLGGGDNNLLLLLLLSGGFGSGGSNTTNPLRADCCLTTLLLGDLLPGDTIIGFDPITYLALSGGLGGGIGIPGATGK